MTVTTAPSDPAAPTARTGIGARRDYHALNAQLNLFAPDGSIQFDKDREAVQAYLAQHVAPKTTQFSSVWERLDWLVAHDYYEEAFLRAYDPDFVDSVHQQAHRAGHRFQTFLGAFKFFTSYALKTFIDDEFLLSRGMRNYWGYQPIVWCAPEPRYALADAEAELRQLVHSLHEAGIEVILDVVYNHTGEGDELGPTLSLRGLHNTGYYRLLDGGRHYVNDAGTGNTVSVDQPITLRLVLDSLRHWASRFGIDGFRFDLATALGRTDQGFDPAAAFFQAVQQDPVLSQVKLIAEPWDIGPGGYQLGHFPHPWSEWNDRFRDGVRRAWRGDAEGKTDIGSRLLGSAGQFDHSARSTTASVNFLTAHDGFTLADVVSYSQKHNEANGEGGQDRHNDNYTDNLGAEGPTDDPEILAARARRVRGMLATLFVAQGVPMMLAGDEVRNSQHGNNNAYCQDGPIGWVDWSNQDQELTQLVCRLTEIRRRFPVLRQRAFLHGEQRLDGHPDVLWQRRDGAPLSYEDWHDPEQGLIAVQLRGAAGDPEGEALADVVFVVLNLGEDTEVKLPALEAGRHWLLEIDTAQLQARGRTGSTYSARAQSVLVFSAAETTG